MKTQIKYLLIFLILAQSAAGFPTNPINDPGFEYVVSTNWTIDAMGMDYLQDSSWKTAGVYSVSGGSSGNGMCSPDGGPIMLEPEQGYILISQSGIDLSNIDTLCFDCRMTLSESYDGDVNMHELQSSTDIYIDGHSKWLRQLTNGNYDNTYLNQSIDVTSYTGTHSVGVYYHFQVQAACDGCDPGCSGEYQYGLKSYVDNFTVIHTPSTPVPEISTFDNLFNCSTLWCMVTVVFTNYEDECSGGGISLFWIVIVLIPFAMGWIKQQSVIIPSILALITGSTLFALLPDTTMSTIIPLLSIGIMGLLYHILKSR